MQPSFHTDFMPNDKINLTLLKCSNSIEIKEHLKY